jgi:CRISPR-associated endonuclease/helicase Cas3
VDGLYFALPTRTSATQIHRRVTEAVASTFEEVGADQRPPVVLAVPGYLRVDELTGSALADFKVLWPDAGASRDRTWAVEHPKRFLAGSVVVGTIDQVLLSTLVVSHAHLRATALSRLFLVVDEVHASDPYMTALLDRVLGFHFACGGHAFLMSATLGTSSQARYFGRLNRGQLDVPLPKGLGPSLESALQVPYPAVHHAIGADPVVTHSVADPGNPKDCLVELWPAVDDAESIAKRALAAARLGAQVLVIRNTVTDAVVTQQALESLTTSDGHHLLFAVEGQATVHHARFADADRRALDEAVEARLGKHAQRLTGSVVVATQTVQQSLDLDADLLLTDLCPMDVLLQRIGRLHRHARPAEERPEGCRRALCVVVDPGSLAELVDDRGHVRSGHGFGSVYGDLRVLEATRDLLVSRPELAIPTDSRELVERSTHPEALAAVVEAAGPPMARHMESAMVLELLQRQLAGGHAIERTRAKGEYGFPSQETLGRVTTRLGAEDRVLEFASGFFTPFGNLVTRLKVPHWLAQGWPAEVAGTAQENGNGSTLVQCLDAEGNVLARFIYDRLGLRREGSKGGTTAQHDAEAD